MPLKWKAKVGARAANYVRKIERDIKFKSCQVNVLATIEVADYFQARGSVVLVMRTPANTRKAKMEPEHSLQAKYPNT